MSDGRFTNLEFDDAAGNAQAADRPAVPTQRGALQPLKDAAYYLLQAERCELAGDPEEALRSFSAALNENPLALDAWVGQLLMLLELREYPEARVWADKALEQFPDNPQLLAAKAVALHRMGHGRDAEGLIDAAVAGKGDFFVVWLCRGEILLADHVPAAESCLQHALRVAQRKPLAQLRVGSLYVRYGRHGAALAVLQEAVTAQPRSAWAWYLLGSAQQKLGLGSSAGISFRQALELAPHNSRFVAASRGGRGPAMLNFFRRLFRR